MLPIRDGDQRIVAALILIGAHPAQFDGMWMRHFCAGLAEAQGRLWIQRRASAGAVVVPETTASAWRRRLFTGGLRMHYQPLVDLRDGRPVGAEALARLEQEDGALIPPGRFLSVLGARDMDELFRLGLAEALEQAALWDQAGLRLGVSLNLAPSTLARPDCVFWVREALGRARVAPARLTLEITEDQALGRPEEGAAAAIAALAELGVGLAMDDLGSGFSSLHRLRSLPFGTVKLDQELMLDARRVPDRSIHFIGSLVQLGRDLEIEVVAEGLESEDLVEAAVGAGRACRPGLRAGPADARRGGAGLGAGFPLDHRPRRAAHPAGRARQHVARDACGRGAGNAGGNLPDHPVSWKRAACWARRSTRATTGCMCWRPRMAAPARAIGPRRPCSNPNWRG